MAHNRTDLDTINIVLQTELEEVEEALRSLKRHGNGGTAPIRDQNLALLQWRTELRCRMSTQQGLREALQMSRESRSDQTAILRDVLNREVDEAPAARVASAGHAPPPQQAPRGALDLIPIPDAQAQARQQEDTMTIPMAPPPVVLRECIACSESRPESDTVQNSCSHVYCQGCVIRLLQNSLADESLFPPRCCRQPLPLEGARGIINDELWARFEEKTIEHGDRHRTYCSDPACSRYILPAYVHGTIATCRVCNRQTCTLCKKTNHQGQCVDDRAEVLELARAEGWQRCSNCNHLVELRSGCNHITCRCRYEFCYVCSARWKQCECAHWDEARLQERAELIAGRNQPAPAPQAVEQAAQFLVAQHECDHDVVWKKLAVAAACEECSVDSKLAMTAEDIDSN
ncbi:hypothetical protein N7519_003224 [Penicillium mononematosum]|uniref:uncharacterized protein n=1 Tax=Penicillium mononematosum TaxID=268346 RepID=UPI00254957B2|nr:uncharacterized protein N7519_003224 [Penicillium mononematosum]KAJ6188316.1 hypothetical protein N7519_003224 [Penicillium mononematosum]